jgi:predicted nuclease with TOPRIM domain
MSARAMSYKEIREILDENNRILNSKLDRLIEKTEAIHIQATKTNGRTTALEDKVASVKKRLDTIEKSDREQEKWMFSQKERRILIGAIITFIISVGAIVVSVI